MFKIRVLYNNAFSLCYMWHFTHNGKYFTYSERRLWTVILAYPCYILLKCLYQDWTVIHLCVRGIDFAPFYVFSVGFWNCSDTGIFLCFSFY